MAFSLDGTHVIGGQSPDSNYSVTQILVDAAGSVQGSYGTITAALAVISGNNENRRYEIIVYPGTYNETSIATKDYVDIIGVDRASCIINGALADLAAPALIEATSTIDFNSTSLLKNLTIRATNLRYAIHTDTLGAADMINRLDNCIVEHLGNQGARTAQSPTPIWGSEIAWAIGTRDGQEINITNSELRGTLYGFSIHNNIGFTKAARVNISGAKLIGTLEAVGANPSGSFRVQSLGSALKDVINLESCELVGQIHHDDDPWLGVVTPGTHIEWEINLNSCNPVFYEVSTDIAGDATTLPNWNTNKYLLNSSGGTISRGMAVAYNTAHTNIRKMTKADIASSFAGVALADIADAAWGYVSPVGIVDPVVFLSQDGSATGSPGSSWGISKVTAGQFSLNATPAIAYNINTSRTLFGTIRNGSESDNNSNTKYGAGALGAATTTLGNSAFGTDALANVVSSGGTQNNVGVGLRAGKFQADGTTALGGAFTSVFLGADTKGVNAVAGQTVIGAGAIGLGANTTVIGALATNLSVTLNGDLKLQKTVTAAGTTGAQTISKPTGTVNFAAAAASLVVTNTLVTTSSIIQLTVGTNDTTMKSAIAVAAAGSFTIFPNANPTAETRVNFTITN
ncbi:MAG: hypothetical protein WC465_04915 [Patescibacteria group bacterium]